MDFDFLSDFVSPPSAADTTSTTVQTNGTNDDYFAQHFWGEKLHGFDVLYHNMKHGQISVRSLQDFIRESASAQDLCAKHLTKLAKLTANFSPVGTFAPMFEALQTVAEKFSSCHMDIVHNFNELVKDLAKYLDEQKSKHKQVKEEMRSTVFVLQQLQGATAALKKSKERYHHLNVEVEKLKRVAALPQDIEKVEMKMKKVADEYKNNVEKYVNFRKDYEQKMTESARRFQELEAAHLEHMRSVLESYILTYENGNVLTGQVHQEFRRQIEEKTIDTLIKQYSETKGTGTEKPEMLKFEEFDVDAELTINETLQSENLSSELKSPRSPSTQTSKINLNLPFLRKKGKKSIKSSSSVKEKSSVESPDKDVSPNVDEEGYTIRPETRKDSSSRKRTPSDSSDSSWGDDLRTKIHVKINPKEPSYLNPENNMDKLNAISKNLIIGPPPVEKKTADSDLESKNKSQTITNGGKASTEQILDLFANKSLPSNPGPKPTVDDIFGETSTPSASEPLPQSSSNLSLNNFFDMSSNKEAENESKLKTKSSANDLVNSSASSTPHSIEFSDLKENSSQQGFSAGLTSPDGVRTPSSLAASFSLENFSSSRGPSPLPVAHGDPIPIAVAFTETVNAMFKGTTENCIAKISGQVQISFPAGIVRNFASNPSPPQLCFLIKGISNIESITPSQSFVTIDSFQSNSQQRSFVFDSLLLSAHIKKMAESNPSAPYYNISVLSYQTDLPSGHTVVPLILASLWKCEADSTEITVNYKYNSVATSSLTNVMVSVPVNGHVTNNRSAPEASWNSTQNRLLWALPTPISRTYPVGTLHSKLFLMSGPSSPSKIAVKFNADGSTVSGADLELVGSGYRLSLVKKRYTAGTYLCNAN